MISDNIAKIRETISAICAKINQTPQQVVIVAVSKGRTIDEIKEVVAAGISDIGENRVQEALTKYNAIRNMHSKCTLANPIWQGAPDTIRIKWHMVGHLQSNKIKEAVKIFDLIHSVDSLHVAAEIDKQAAKINKIQDILVEINTSGEAAKYGFRPEAVMEAVKTIAALKHIALKGLMTIAPIVDNTEKTRPYFRKPRELLQEINAIRNMHSKCTLANPIWQGAPDTIRILSMGMSDDYRIAIEEGSTMVRLGRAIFGNGHGNDAGIVKR